MRSERRQKKETNIDRFRRNISRNFKPGERYASGGGVRRGRRRDPQGACTQQNCNGRPCRRGSTCVSKMLLGTLSCSCVVDQLNTTYQCRTDHDCRAGWTCRGGQCVGYNETPSGYYPGELDQVEGCPSGFFDCFGVCNGTGRGCNVGQSCNAGSCYTEEEQLYMCDGNHPCNGPYGCCQDIPGGCPGGNCDWASCDQCN